ncbi:hypothetical protein [Alkalihalobacillus pseudalcaliphilus]|uniref:YphA family membrane protein n=1 Tax=Alkalihalobacillus pseudalcaliphilus TaxID=79884 RepID=UPI00069E146F|nr:hypothetical protein [Alkalihalobacillus pseudalcaliphilus]
MEGIYFYWVSWLAWAFYTFISKKTTQRTWLSMSILIVIICMPQHVKMGDLNISLGIIFGLLILSYMCFHYRPGKLLYLFILTTFLASAYTAFDIFTIYDPVVLFIAHPIYLAGISFIFAFFLLGTIKDRLIAALLGLIQGECFSGIVRFWLVGKAEIGRMLFWDAFAYVVIAFLVVGLIKYVLDTAFRLLQPQTNQSSVPASSWPLITSRRQLKQLQRQQSIKIDAQ